MQTRDDIETFGGERNRRFAMSSKGWIGQLWMANYSINARIPLAEGFADHLAAVSRFSVELGDEKTEEELLGSVAASFVHGGIHPAWAAKPYALHYMNDLGSSLLYKAIDSILPSPVSLPKNTTAEEAALYGTDGRSKALSAKDESKVRGAGPLWYRGYALDEDEEVVCTRVDEALRDLKVRHVIMASFDGIWSRCGGKAIFIDTGTNTACYFTK